jgi:hypothetical protein
MRALEAPGVLGPTIAIERLRVGFAGNAAARPEKILPVAVGGLERGALVGSICRLEHLLEEHRYLCGLVDDELVGAKHQRRNEEREAERCRLKMRHADIMSR